MEITLIENENGLDVILGNKTIGTISCLSTRHSTWWSFTSANGHRGGASSQKEAISSLKDMNSLSDTPPAPRGQGPESGIKVDAPLPGR